MPKTRKQLFILLLFLCSLLLTGCAFKDIDKSVFVAMIALDQSDDPEKPYKITLKLYEPTSSFKEATAPAYSYLTENGETLSEALRILESYSDKELELGHSKLIVIGEALVHDDKNKEILDFLLRRPDIQLISWVSIGRPTAEKVIKLIPQGETAAYPELFNYFDDNGTISPYIVTTHLFNFRRNMKVNGMDTVVPIIELDEKDEHFKINKSLVLADKKEPHELDALNTSIYNMLMGSTKLMDLIIEEEDEHFIAKIDSIQSDYKVKKIENEKIALNINVSLFGYISESKHAMKNKDLPRYNELLKKESEEKLTGFLTEMTDLGYDPLGFGIDYKAKVLHNKRMPFEAWEEAYEEAEVNVTVTPGLKSTGSIQ